MNKTINYVLVGLVALVIGLMIGLHSAKPSVQVGSTPAGGTTSTAHFYGVAVDMTATATSSSILNPTGNDLYVTSIKVGCENLGTFKSYVANSGLANLTFTLGTSSTGSPITAAPTTNAVGGGSTNISTTTGTNLVASTTANSGSTAYTNIWAAGSYMTVYHNATSSTGSCTAGVEAFSS